LRAEDIENKIRGALPDARVELRDLTGTADHWEATIVSQAFAGKSLLERHRMVFAALAEEMKGPIHALSLKTFTPDQAPGSGA
jgi:stress-induced morphogen